jgi:hypothetical protein
MYKLHDPELQRTTDNKDVVFYAVVYSSPA